ncbi:hypothetical protein [Magnetospirillum sp. SS-4]|uniref:hypothetical protein n=1 Tax=Magnetospirillum sp. SS-4 TaxID=2681465 RepID=UPI00137E5DFE|nr:hypothetical protein [Magnetospirillum sp. SS-4]CAA7617417.1 conserved hypothetical protein [Magnetospirillum sp. SS-4]
MAETQKIHAFFSWQSDSPGKTNQNAIRDALNVAAKKISAERADIEVVPDEATREASGSPNIVSKLLEKIQEAEIFIADITTITLPGAERPCPNPNVTYELGYAVAELGWDRIILLFNEALGVFPADLPFDFAQHRVSRYRFAQSDDPKAVRGRLEKLLNAALNAILDKNPKRPAEVRGLSREKLEHDHDVENMNWLMSAIHPPTLDQHILDLPHSISDRALWFWENFKGVFTNSLFNIYDPVLKGAVERLFLGWRTAISHGELYHDTPAGLHVFTNPGDMPLTGKHQQAWNEINSARTEMRRAFDQILERLREGYIEVNIHKANAKAWDEYVEFKKKFREIFDDN